MKKVTLKTTILLLFTAIVFTACSSDDSATKSSEALLKSLKLTKADNPALYTDVETQVNEETKEITATINAIVAHSELDKDLSLTPTLVISDKASVNAESITLKKDGTPTTIVVTAEDGTAVTYTFKPVARYINKVATEVVAVEDLIALYAIQKANPDNELYWQLNEDSANTIKKSLTNNYIVLSDKRAIDIGIYSRVITKLPKEIENLTSLNALNIQNNQELELPAELGKLNNLKSLVLYNNGIKSLPEEIVNLKKLTEINLNNNNIESLTTAQCTFIKSINEYSLDSGLCN